ncbi:MAG: hypothetical protein OEY97_01050 [Nitrospirota bacterium]|nr:hypothetical protein [Nitrospirota bacterium]
MSRFLTLLVLLVACMAPAAAWAVSPADPVRARFANDFQTALEGYQRLGQVARERAEQGLVPLGFAWESEMRTLDRLLVRHESVFFPMMGRPWTRESAVFSNLQGARMWLWSVFEGLRDGASGVESIDVRDGRLRDELLLNFLGYLDKAGDLLVGGEFKGSYFEDTLTPVLADYCAYPEEGERVKPSFDDPRIFDDARAVPVASGPEGAS